MKRPTFKDFKKVALEDGEVKAEYDALAPLFDIKKQLINARLNKGVTQDEIAHKIGTSKSSISRLESLNNTFMPNVGTLMKYAEALGLKLNVGLK
ncbi:MAG: helix-turn-helix transcriptional regulator [Sulfurovum sp.]|nr:helix-turn-helix transcriptional regulator [Sulfurovum sp.]